MLSRSGEVGTARGGRGSSITKDKKFAKVTKVTGGKPDAEAVAKRIIGMAIKIHRAVGPGFEHTYEDCPKFEMSRVGLRFQRQVELNLICEGVRFDRTYRAFMVVENCFIPEIKSIESILPIHHSQVLTYLRATGCRIGLPLIFNTVLIKHSFRRFVS